MPITGVVYFSHEQKDDQGKIVAEPLSCEHCKEPLVAEPFLIMAQVQDRRSVLESVTIYFAHVRCEKAAFA